MRSPRTRSSSAARSRTSGEAGARPAADIARASRAVSISSSSSARPHLDLGCPAHEPLGLDLRVGGDLGHPRPADRVGPRPAHRAVALVARAGRPALATEPVAGVVAPQAPVVAHPPGRVVDDDRMPRVPAGPADAAVAAGVVHVGDTQPLVGGCTRPRGEQPRDPADHADEPTERRGRDGDQVVAGQVGTGVRAGPGEHHGVPALDQAQVWVVPAAAQVVAGLVVRGEHHPAGLGQALAVHRSGAVEVDRHLLPVGLVLVDPAERPSASC